MILNLLYASLSMILRTARFLYVVYTEICINPTPVSHHVFSQHSFHNLDQLLADDRAITECCTVPVISCYLKHQTGRVAKYKAAVTHSPCTLVHWHLQSWPKLCGTSLQNALPRRSISFSHGNKRSLGQILPSPLPPCNVVRKERLAEESSNIASGGEGGASEYCGKSGKRHSVPHILARIVASLVSALAQWHL